MEMTGRWKAEKVGKDCKIRKTGWVTRQRIMGKGTMKLYMRRNWE